MNGWMDDGLSCPDTLAMQLVGDDLLAVVVGVGSESQWGKIKANLVCASCNTPLQDKLEAMTGQVTVQHTIAIHYVSDF